MSYSQQFEENVVHLHNPEKKTIQQAFRDLPKRGMFQIQCPWDNRLTIINQLDQLGCFGIFLMPSNDWQTLTVTAYKGKSGPCYETGRSAVYQGVAAAVLDDDSHLIYGKMRICEKTAHLYSLPIYSDFIDVSDGDPSMLAQLDSSPILFDCDTYETNLSRLVESIPEKLTVFSFDTAVLYPGPFRLLILANGIILSRGLVTLISSSQAKILHQKDNIMLMPSSYVTEAVSPFLLQNLVKSRGSGCLFFDLEDSKKSQNSPARLVNNTIISEPDYSTLETISPNLKSRLLRLIEKNEPYFILTGSDPENESGCCPNNLVGEANILVQSRILSCYSPLAPAEACSSAFYAFFNERDSSSPPNFHINKDFREKVYRFISGNSKCE